MSIPVAVVGGHKFAKLGHACGIDANGTTFCWGRWHWFLLAHAMCAPCVVCQPVRATGVTSFYCMFFNYVQVMPVMAAWELAPSGRPAQLVYRETTPSFTSTMKAPSIPKGVPGCGVRKHAFQTTQPCQPLLMWPYDFIVQGRTSAVNLAPMIPVMCRCTFPKPTRSLQ